MRGSVTADAGSELVTANGDRFKRRQIQIPEDFEHVSPAQFCGDRADISRFGAVFWAPERRMAGIDIPVQATHRIRNVPIDRVRDSISAQARALSPQTPFGGKVNRQGGNDPVRPFFRGGEVLVDVRNSVCDVQRTVGACCPQEIVLDGIHQYQMRMRMCTG